MPTSPNNIQQYPTFLTKVKLCPTSSNNTQHHPTMPNMGGQTIPTFIPNIVGICWAKMLASFGQGLREQPPRLCKNNNSKINCESAIGQHLLTNPQCAKTYKDDNFWIIGQGRSSFHLSVLESVYIKTQNPVLCKQKDFIFALGIFK